MISLTDLTPSALRKAADLQEQIQGLRKELAELLGGVAAVPAPTTEPIQPPKEGRKKFSAKTRAKMAAAQQARWAAKKGPNQEATKATTTAEPAATPKKKQLSDARLKALAKAREARWGKLNAKKGKSKAKLPF